MSFDIGEQARAERAQPRWMRYTGEGVTIHCKIRPRDEEAVEALEGEFPLPERLTRAGRIHEPRLKAEQDQWTAGYLAAHIEDWDLTVDTVKAPINRSTVHWLTPGMKTWVIDRTMVDNPAAFEVPDPFVASDDGSRRG